MQFLIQFLKLAEGGGHFYMQKTMHFVLHFYMKKNMHFYLRFYVQKVLYFALHFYMQKTMHLALHFISKIYRMVLMPNYEGMYDQSDQIEK